MTKLIEFYNKEKEILRGLIDESESSDAVIFVHGFERTTIETKFKNIIDVLKHKKNLFRFDFTGCGLSDGDFSKTTIAKMTSDLDYFVKQIKIVYPHINKFSFVGHSAGCCVILNYITTVEVNFNKIIFLAPALNQKDLHRFWFTKSIIYKENKNLEITLNNYKDYFDEKEFLLSVNTHTRELKEHYIDNDYFLENLDKDYQSLLNKTDLEDILIIHSLQDSVVPFYSNDNLPNGIKTLKLEKGDHDLEKPSVVKLYLEDLIKFLE